MWWTDGSGRIELNITKAQAKAASHPGRCDEDVAALCKVPVIRRQLDKLDTEHVRECLAEYGAWDADELNNDETNRARLVWIAVGDIAEGRTI